MDDNISDIKSSCGKDTSTQHVASNLDRTAPKHPKNSGPRLHVQAKTYPLDDTPNASTFVMAHSAVARKVRFTMVPNEIMKMADGWAGSFIFFRSFIWYGSLI